MPRKRTVVIWSMLMVVAAAAMNGLPIHRMPLAVRRFYFSEKLHIAAHIFLYGMLSCLIAAVLWRRSGAALISWQSAAIVALTLSVGLAQEIVQVIARRLPAFRIYEAFDLGVDLFGAVVGLLIFHFFERRRAARAQQQARTYSTPYNER